MIQELSHEINKTAKSVLSEIHTAIPCRILSVDYTRCIVTAQPLGTFRMDGKAFDYPIISDVPVVLPFAPGDIGIAFPVRGGDSALLVISEAELDEWRTGTKSQGSLRFDLTNAICIPGLLQKPVKQLREASEKNSVIISSGTASISIGGSGIAIQGNITVNGSIRTSGDVVSGEVSLQNHSH